MLSRGSPPPPDANPDNDDRFRGIRSPPPQAVEFGLAAPPDNQLGRGEQTPPEGEADPEPHFNRIGHDEMEELVRMVREEARQGRGTPDFDLPGTPMFSDNSLPVSPEPEGGEHVHPEQRPDRPMAPIPPQELQGHRQAEERELTTARDRPVAHVAPQERRQAQDGAPPVQPQRQAMPPPPFQPRNRPQPHNQQPRQADHSYAAPPPYPFPEEDPEPRRPLTITLENYQPQVGEFLRTTIRFNNPSVDGVTLRFANRPAPYQVPESTERQERMRDPNPRPRNSQRGPAPCGCLNWNAIFPQPTAFNWHTCPACPYAVNPSYVYAPNIINYGGDYEDDYEGFNDYGRRDYQ